MNKNILTVAASVIVLAGASSAIRAEGGALAQARGMAANGAVSLDLGYENAASLGSKISPVYALGGNTGVLPRLNSVPAHSVLAPSAKKKAVSRLSLSGEGGIEKKLRTGAAYTAGAFGAITGFVLGTALWPPAIMVGLAMAGDFDELFIFPIFTAVALSKMAYKLVMDA